MACPRCALLEERIAWLEGELGVQLDQTQTRLICSAFAMTQTEAWFALVLWKAKGRTVDRYWLLDNRPKARERNQDGDRDNMNMLRVYICKLRKLLGPHVEPEWGKGYYLTKTGLELIDEAIRAGTQGENNANRSARRYDAGIT